MGIFAIKDIQENEELTFDYQFDFFKTPCTRCYCGSKNCKMFLGVATGKESASDSSENDYMRGSSDESDNSIESTENIQDAIATGDKPLCFHCNKEINDTKQIVICKGACNKLFHL